MMQPKTYSAKPTETQRQWYLLDASEATLGRLSTAAAKYLIGKHKPSYTPHIDGGDGVVVINATKLKVTGNKLQQKTYYRHSGHPGSLKSLSLEEQLAKDPTKVVIQAVQGMLPKNKLQAGRLSRLKVYAGSEHELEAQKPQKVEVS